MCGIFGWLGSEAQPPEEFFANGAVLLEHRGPDDSGVDMGPGWGLGFRRLSILDLSASGHQPMRSSCGRYRIVFNGEIYNYLELREELEAAGERFASDSDTEVLLRLVAIHWEEALARLNGMFAFVVIDTQLRRFLIARDRLGVKPIYYTCADGRLSFGSELKVLAATASNRMQVDRSAIAEYLGLGYLSGNTCIFSGCRKLPPGCLLSGWVDRPDDGKVQRYWRLELNPEVNGPVPGHSGLDDLETLLADATRLRLRSDVPVGVFLSGGIDSGLVATLAGRVALGTRPLALSVGFAEEDYDETASAAAVAENAGLRHEIIRLRPAGLQMIDRLAWYFDEPFGDSSALPTYVLCEAASAHATVFLAGDGGDEAFGGYRRYIEVQRYRWLDRIPSPLRCGLEAASRALPSRSVLRQRLAKSTLRDSGYAAAFDGIPEDSAIASILHPSLWKAWPAAGRVFWETWGRSAGMALTARQQQLDYDLYLPDDILVKVDRASMAHSIEVRSPFLDYRVVEWAGKLPRGMLLNQERGKLPLRELGRRLLPTKISNAQKRGFGVPIDLWFRESVGQEFLRGRLLSPEAARREWWRLGSVATLIKAHGSGTGRDFSTLLWRLLILDAWARHYVDAATIPFRPPPCLTTEQSG
jgi:asparagine synthase (glutamine-hydrolysing)